MDKRWRNLGILVLIVLVLAVVLVVKPQIPFLSQTKTLEQGYGEMLGLFQKNDVNLSNVQILNIVSTDESNNVVWVEKKANLDKTRSDLVSFSSNLSSYTPYDSNQLKAISNIYISAIDFGYKTETVYTKIASTLKVADCQNLSSLNDLNKQMFLLYLDVFDLSSKVDQFKLDYDLSAEPLLIDLPSEYQAYEDVSTTIDEINAQCKVGA